MYRFSLVCYSYITIIKNHTYTTILNLDTYLLSGCGRSSMYDLNINAMEISFD